VEDIRLLYANPFELLRDLRAAGETNAIRQRTRVTSPRALFAAALARLPADEERAAVTLRLAVMTGWAPA
jgi:NADH dehydrogenase [ubiquinone] 1 alpha subcomplex assembly factor 5